MDKVIIKIIDADSRTLADQKKFIGNSVHKSAKPPLKTIAIFKITMKHGIK